MHDVDGFQFGKMIIETLQGVLGSGENGVKKYREQGAGSREHGAKKTREQGAGSRRFWPLYSHILQQILGFVTHVLTYPHFLIFG